MFAAKPRDTDRSLQTAIQAALDVTSIVPRGVIATSVSDGVVTLTGEVPYTTQRLEAANAVRRVRGVRAVRNEVVVREPKVAPHTVRAAIADALEQQARRQMRAIQVDIVDGRVVLTGDVHSEAERRAIVGATAGTQGVEAVVDQLRIV